MSTITKRLHISGLTPSLSPSDLSQRLSTFGKVKALDGFGQLDAIGQPKKFGYVTIEATEAGLRKCLNALSGSTYKGAKIRIGEAKPDFQERLAKERALPSEPPPPKRRRLSKYQATQRSDMSLVTAENVGEPGKGGWKVTEMGRVVRNLRMRPERVLVLARDLEKAGNARKSGKEANWKAKKRVKMPLVRARRRTIDMIKWGSVHLKGSFLDVVSGSVQGNGMRVESGAEKRGEDDVTADEDVSTTIPQRGLPPLIASSSPPPVSPLDPHESLLLEKSASLNLLKSLFGDKEDEEWGGRESLSDLDVNEERRETEDVGMDVYETTLPVQDSEEIEDDTKTDEAEPEPESEHQPEPTLPKTQATNLRELFAPREEQAGFSLLGHLDLDLELDDDFTIPHPASAQPPTAPPTNTYNATYPISTSTPINTHDAPFVPNPHEPFFFPTANSTSSSALTSTTRAKDPFTIAQAKGWNWRDASVGFYRSQTDEEIRKRWDDGKGELTRGWKRRWREARKVRRRRGAGGDAE